MSDRDIEKRIKKLEQKSDIMVDMVGFLMRFTIVELERMHPCPQEPAQADPTAISSQPDLPSALKEEPAELEIASRKREKKALAKQAHAAETAIRFQLSMLPMGLLIEQVKER